MAKVSPNFDAGPERSPVALLIIDMINDLDFPGGPDLLRHALTAARAIRGLKRRAAEAGVAAIYVNDNFGQWRSDFRQIVAHCGAEGGRGAPLVEVLVPEERDYFVVKPRHSGFFTTTLELLLNAIGANTLVLTGTAGDICVLFTANDAYMRGFRLIVPPDCVASESAEYNEQALSLMERRLKAELTPSEAIDFAALCKGETA